MSVEEIDYSKTNIGKIVAKDYRKAMVFKSFGLDFCCGGAIKLEEAAKESNLDLNHIVEELKKVDLTTETDEDYDTWALDKLVDHIISKHHGYVRNTIEQLTPMLAKVEMVHGQWRPELVEVNQLFKEISNELIPHMQKEEMILFPAIKELLKGHENGSSTCFGSVQNPINMMLIEHDAAGDLMKKINSLTSGYTLPKGACATYTVVYKVLSEFENDLFTHIHLENNILFPKAIILDSNN